MQLDGKAIVHETFGNGTITAISDNAVTVSFSQGEKRFLYPEAFVHFIKLKDKQAQEQVNNMLLRKKREAKAHMQAAEARRERLQRISNLKITLNSQAAFGLVCNDSKEVFSSWSVSTGRNLSGLSKGMPRTPAKLRPNSACLLTACPEGAKENERRIIGAFMVREDFFGDLCKDGIILAHDRYRIELQESETLPLWNYFEETKLPKRWGNTEFKYFAGNTMQRILYDMKNKIVSPERRELAEDFYRYFCNINRLADHKSNP